MRYTVTETAPADIYGDNVKAGDVISLTEKQAAVLLRKGHLTEAKADTAKAPTPAPTSTPTPVVETPKK